MRTVILFLFLTPFLFAADTPIYSNKLQLLVYRDEAGEEKKISTVAGWQFRRNHILQNFQVVAGTYPAQNKMVPAQPIIRPVGTDKEFKQYKISILVESGDRLPFDLIIPNGRGQKFPAILALHPTNQELGRQVVLGKGAKTDRHYALELCKRGYVVLAPDYVNMGEYKVDVYALGYESATMKAIWNHRRCLDYLVQRPEVDSSKLGVIGHSLGGHNALFLGLFDRRVKCIVTSCGFCSFPTYMQGNLAGWSHAGYMPKIWTAYKNDPKQIPFDFSELLGALAPTPIFVSAPIQDSNFNVAGVRECIQAAEPVYQLHNTPERLKAIYPEAGHDFPDVARHQAYEFLDKWLKLSP